MSRRLLNRAGAPAAARSANRSTTTALPEYEPPACPLDDQARQALGQLSGNRVTTAPYAKELKNVLGALGSSVGVLHERLSDARDRLTALREKREGRGDHDQTPEEQRLETHVEELEKDVDDLTLQSERAVRDLIDKQAELEDEGVVLGELYTHAVSQSRGNDGAADENEPPQVPSQVDAYRELSARKVNEYTSMSMHQRYALNNDYAAFKKMWHDAMAGEDGPPLPDASRWFRPDGEPVMKTLGRGADEDEGSDEDIAVAREVLSIKCPLTLRPMDEPYSNRKCKHTFEKAAILDYLTGESVECPQTGCSQRFSRSEFDQDFYLDQVMLRRIERARQAERREMDEDDEDEADIDGDSVMAVEVQRRRRRTKTPKRERE